MTLRPGPFQVIDNSGLESPSAPVPPPSRRYDCKNYETCLDLSAALDWQSFSCHGCCGEINNALCWRAHQAERIDPLVKRICDHIPSINTIQQSCQNSNHANSDKCESSKNPRPIKVVAK